MPKQVALNDDFLRALGLMCVNFQALESYFIKTGRYRAVRIVGESNALSLWERVG
jgi:hypothetical protein